MDFITSKYGPKEGLTTSCGEILNWPYSEPKPTKEDLALMIDQDLKTQEIKAKAQADIFLEYTDYQQHNILMSGDQNLIAEMNKVISKIRNDAKEAITKIIESGVII